MYNVILAGGSGLRVLESIIHCCAMGLGPRVMRLFVIDPDHSNGNATRASRLVSKYLECQKAYGGKLGKDANWFGTELDLLGDPTKPELMVWSPVKPNDTLGSIIDYDNLASTNTPPEVADLLFTREERQVPLGGGFRGHPAIGAASMSQIPFFENERPWSEFIQRIRGDVDQGPSYVFIVGSVFGGTGASTLHPVGRYVQSIPERNHDRLKIAFNALVPYFRFSEEKKTGKGPSDAGGLVARSENFSLATKAAVEFYAYLKENHDWPFAMSHWVGDSGLMDVDWAPHGAGQENPAHFVDVLSALACLEFFAAGTTGVADGASLYSGPRGNVVPPAPEFNLLEWPDVPLRAYDRSTLQREMLRFYMSGAAHLGFYEEVLQRTDLDKRSKNITWYHERFRGPGKSLRTAEAQHDLKVLTEYLEGYYFPWWQQIHGTQTSTVVRLVNAAGLVPRGNGKYQVDLQRLTNLFAADRPGDVNADHFDRFYTDVDNVKVDEGGSAGAGAYFSLLAHGASRFIEREYLRKAEAAHA